MDQILYASNELLIRKLYKKDLNILLILALLKAICIWYKDFQLMNLHSEEILALVTVDFLAGKLKLKFLQSAGVGRTLTNIARY